MAENRVQVQDIRKDLWCWHCLRWIRWIPNPYQIQNMQDFFQRPQKERQTIMVAHGTDPAELGLNPQAAAQMRFREFGVQQLNPWSRYPSLMNLMDGAIDWRAERGGYMPYCPLCSKALLHQSIWAEAKGWIKYPLLILGIGVSLWFLTILLGREVLFWG